MRWRGYAYREWVAGADEGGPAVVHRLAHARRRDDGEGPGNMRQVRWSIREDSSVLALHRSIRRLTQLLEFWHDGDAGGEPVPEDGAAH